MDTPGSAGSKKIVSFIRHGQAQHNYTRDVTQKTEHYLDPAFTDCPLTERGYSQAKALQDKLPGVIELVIVSPLERTLQTALTIFGKRLDQVGKGKAIPMIALECVREVAGKHYPDKRTKISEKTPRYKEVDFSLTSTDEDVLWAPEAREPQTSVDARINEFLDWISKRPEIHIVVVTHHAFLRNTFLKLTGKEETFANCEMRTITIPHSN